jgi:hypothetical protein
MSGELSVLLLLVTVVGGAASPITSAFLSHLR